MKRRLGVLLLTAASATSLAHHATALFDLDRTVIVDGVVRSFEWTNPHAWIWIESTTPAGTTTRLGFECGALGILRRQGWTRGEFVPGDHVKVSFHPFKDGTPGGGFVSATFADGHVLGSRDPGKGGAPPAIAN